MNVDSEAVERALRLAVYMSNHPVATLNEIAIHVEGYDPDANFETKRKKVQRDFAVLREQFGIHADWSDGRANYTLRPGFFTQGERLALIAASDLIGVEGISGAAAEELIRIGAAVDDRNQRVIVAVQEHIHKFRDAIAARRGVAFRYHDQDRLLEPWGLGLWRNHWYVRGIDRLWPLEHGGSRTYRLDRIQDTPRLLDPSGDYLIPPDFDPDAPYNLDPNAWGHDAPVTVQVEVELDDRRRFARDLQATEIARSDTTVTFEVAVREYRSFCDRILHFGPRAVVRSPEVIVTMLTDRLRALAGTES
jgi:predicted DNA-binding transcriptional regulator YafY